MAVHKKKASTKKKSITIENFAVRQVAVNLISGDTDVVCPQSPQTRFNMMAMGPPGCPYPSVCPRITISEVAVVVGVPPLSPADLTKMLTALKPPKPYKKIRVTVVASKAKHKATVAAIKKAK